MKAALKTWKFSIAILFIGLVIWIGLVSLSVQPKKTMIDHNIYLAPKPYLVLPAPAAPKVDVYGEVKFWAEWLGKIMTGVGSLGILYKGMRSLRGRKE